MIHSFSLTDDAKKTNTYKYRQIRHLKMVGNVVFANFKEYGSGSPIIEESAPKKIRVLKFGSTWFR